ncbi:MAG: hypothetical protein AB1505_15470, partial [Candidatus Latescibacterota bacterium]
MADLASDGLARLQSQSRIPANTWRQWCAVLKLDPHDAVDVWEEICHPLMVATRRVPDVPFALQLRAARLDVDIFDFKEEAPKILHTITFLNALADDRLTGGKLKAAVIKLYHTAARRMLPSQPQGQAIPRFIAELCSAVLVAKVLPTPSLTLSAVLKPIWEGHGDIERLARMCLRILGDAPYAAVVRDCLSSAQQVGEAPAPRPAAPVRSAGEEADRSGGATEADDQADEVA